jgi:uncharacterized metal-binding protein YceD (DUF177 family)
MAESPYLLRFVQLPAGTHEFTFRINGDFFRERGNAIIRDADIQVKATLLKGSGAMQLLLEIEGDAEVECVRCLEPFRLPVFIEKELVVRMVDHPENEDDDDDAIHVAKTAHEMELSNTFYDFICLEVPYSPVHPDQEDGSDGCNPEVVKHLQQPEKPNQSEAETPADDRWAALRKIKLN